MENHHQPLGLSPSIISTSGMENHHQPFGLSPSRISTSDVPAQLFSPNNYHMVEVFVPFSGIQLSFNHSRILIYGSKKKLKALTLEFQGNHFELNLICLKLERLASIYINPPPLHHKVEIKAPKCEQKISPPHPCSCLGSRTPSLGGYLVVVLFSGTIACENYLIFIINLNTNKKPIYIRNQILLHSIFFLILTKTLFWLSFSLIPPENFPVLNFKVLINPKDKKDILFIVEWFCREIYQQVFIKNMNYGTQHQVLAIVPWCIFYSCAQDCYRDDLAQIINRENSWERNLHTSVGRVLYRLSIIHLSNTNLTKKSNIILVKSETGFHFDRIGQDMWVGPIICHIGYDKQETLNNSSCSDHWGQLSLFYGGWKVRLPIICFSGSFFRKTSIFLKMEDPLSPIRTHDNVIVSPNYFVNVDSRKELKFQRTSAFADIGASPYPGGGVRFRPESFTPVNKKCPSLDTNFFYSILCILLITSKNQVCTRLGWLRSVLSLLCLTAHLSSEDIPKISKRFYFDCCFINSNHWEPS
ncbi:hypothetical protein VP01_1312g1 [Puccinia sorghi]|uniref:Uncharacterized protein n=1 Tax=Puccinia sorghi TaxID=27349 RepID=A0A0L6VNE6_9BASI|nr:hypothetical protein VP01_1312g1 [Puccinia sorghi]